MRNRMMSKIGNWSLDDIDSELDALSSEEVIERMIESIDKGMKAWLVAGRAYHILWERGDLPDDIPPHLEEALRRLGNRELHPAAWTRFHGTYVGRHIHKLSYPKQEAIAKGEPVKVYSFENGNVDHRKADIEDLVYSEQKQVLGPNGLRNAAEQRSYLEDKRAKKMPKNNQPSEPVMVVRGKRKRGVLVKPNDDEVFISHEQLSKYAAETA